MKLSYLSTTFLILATVGAMFVAPHAEAQVEGQVTTQPRAPISNVRKARAVNKKLTNTTQSLNPNLKQAAVQPDYVFSTLLEVVRSTSLYDLKNGAKYDGMDYATSFSLLTPAGIFATKLSVTQVLSPTDEDTTILNDSHISYSHTGITLYKDQYGVVTKFVPGGAVIIPLSKRSKDVEQLQTAVIGSAALMIQAGEHTALKGLTLGLSLSFGQNFHQHDTDVNGTILNKTSSNQALSLAYLISDFSFTVSYANRIRWPYAGDVRQSFELSEEIGYRFLKNWGVMVGHTNAGSTLKPNGYDSNVSLVDEDNSVVYIGLSFGF